MRNTGMLGPFSIVLSIVSVAIVVPLGLIHHSGLIHDELRGREAALSEITSRQLSLLEELGKLQDRVFSVQSTIQSMTKKSDDAVDPKELLELKKSVLRKEFEAYGEKVELQLEKLEKETKMMFADLKDMVDAHSNRFIVKWHGDNGVKTSKRMSTEQDALEKFNDVGEFAKKLLMFDGSKWVVLKEYGGQNWLEMLKNDGNPQDGEGVPDKQKDEQEE